MRNNLGPSHTTAEPAAEPVDEPAASFAATDTGLAIDRARRVALLNGVPLKLGSRAFDLLALLAGRPGRLFLLPELMAAVWPGRVVEEANLRVQINALRQQLGAALIVNVAGRGYAFAVPAGPVPPPRSSNLPAQAEPLLGRETDLQTLARLLATHPLVTVLGAGGIGKTRLALAAAQQSLALHADGVWWVDLAPLLHSGQIATAIARALGLQSVPMDGPEATVRLGFALAGRDLLLVLDNAEHLATTLAPLLTALLQAAPTLRLLVTSQRLLRAPGEQACRLAPLAVPAPGATSAQVRGCAALQLLEQRAQAADAGFAFSDADLPAAGLLCRSLDGIALALEMAGARLPQLGLAELNDRLAERLELLGSDGSLRAQRHRTLQAALDWSCSLLSDDESTVLRRLSVFAVAFRLRSAQLVAADGALNNIVALRAIVSLADKSLLQVQTVSDPAEPRRYRLLESTRLHATLALTRSGETSATQARHAQAMAALTEQAGIAYWHTPDRAWLDSWRADHEDWLLGFDRACVAVDAESASVIGEALLAMANLNGVYGPIHARLPDALALLPQAGPLARARLWNRSSGLSAPGLTRYEAARRRVEAWRLVDEPQGLSRALAKWAGEQERADCSEAADAALSEIRALEDPQWSPRQRVMGAPMAAYDMAVRRGDAQLMRQCMQAWVALAQAGGLGRISAQARNNLALVELQEGQPHQAVILLRAAGAECRALGCDLEVSVNLGYQANALLATGAVDASRDAIEQALMLMLAPEAHMLLLPADTLALLALQLGRPADAARMLGAAQALRAQIAMPREALEQRKATQLHDALLATLGAAALQDSMAEGARLDAHGLHQAALAWLHSAR